MYTLGVDIGGTKIAAGVVDEAGKILAQVRRPTLAEEPASIDEAVASAYRELAADFEISAIGVAAAGFIGADRRTIPFASNIAWRDYPIADRIEALLGNDEVRVFVENDANAAGWAEFRFGAARNVNDMIMLTVGTGLGGAIVLNGQLWRGSYGMAAELGHVLMVPQGQLCGCGRHGCWEQYASGRALVREAKRLARNHPERATKLRELGGDDLKGLSGPQVTLAAQQGDSVAIESFTTLAHWLAQGSVDMTVIFDPQMIVIGGGVAEAGDLLLNPVRHSYRENLVAGGHRTVCQIELAQQGNEAGMVGAADLARS